MTKQEGSYSTARAGELTKEEMTHLTPPEIFKKKGDEGRGPDDMQDFLL